MNSWLYPEVVREVKDACVKFINGELDEVALQKVLYNAEQEIVAYEEAWFRSILLDVESKIERVIYMEPPENQMLILRQVVQELLCTMEDNCGFKS